MAKGKKVDLKSKKKVVRKSFYAVSVPLTSANISLYGSGVDDLDGRTVKVDLTRSLKGKSFELKFKVKADGEELVGEPRSLRLVSSYVRKVMRRGTDYVEDSFEAECKDGKVKVKPFLITRKRVSRAVRKALRDAARKNLLTYLKARKVEEGFSEMMANKMQRDLSAKLRKIYPLALCEIRRFERIEEKRIE